MPQLTATERRERVGKLPKWAQDYIRDLTEQRDAEAEAYEDLAAGKYGPADTDTHSDPYSESPVALPKGGLVGFRLGYGEDDELVVRVTAEGLQVQGDKGLIVAPSSSNVVTIELRRR